MNLFQKSLCNVLSNVVLFSVYIWNISTRNGVTKILNKKLYCHANKKVLDKIFFSLSCLQISRAHFSIFPSDCTHVIKLGRDQRATVNTPSYPLSYRNDTHCNWLVYLPKPEMPVSILAMDFDVGGSAPDQMSCASPVVQLYRNLHSFSKYRIGSYCNNSKMAMPRETKLTADSLRISFTGGYNHMARHRGFSLLIWSSQQGMRL